VHDRLEIFGQKRHGGLPVLLRLVVAFFGLIPALFSTSPNHPPAESAQIPESLQEWSRLDSFPLTDGLKDFREGMGHFAGRRYASALEAFGDHPVTQSTSLGDYILYYRAKSNLQLERKKEALGDLQLLERLFPESPLFQDALEDECQLLLGMNDARAVLTVLSNPKIRTSPDVLFCQAKAFDLASEKEKAAEFFLRIYSRYPTSKYASAAEKYFVSSSPQAFKGSRNYEARLQRAESLIGLGDYREARTILLGLARASAPSSTSAEKRNLLFGEVEYRLGRVSRAIPYFQKVTAANPALHSRALYLEGSSARRLDREDSLLALRDKLLKLYPRSADAEELCYSAATYFDVNFESAQSRAAYSLLYEAFPKGKYAERALWKLALFPYSEKKYGEAALGFWKYLRAYPAPSSASGAMYWMGRCYEKLGDTESAKYLYQRARALANNNYYGLRAREAEAAVEETSKASRSSVQGIDFGQVVATCDAIQPTSSQLAEPDSAAARVIQRARLLVAAGCAELALTELRWGRSRYPKSEDALSYVMSRIYVDSQDYDAAISSLRRAFPDYVNYPPASLPEEVWKIFFPVLHWELISEQAAKFEVDPNLVLGLIRQESAFNEKARSKANARGLMQILPSNGRILARRARIKRYSLKKLYQAETNVILGTMYFASVLRRFEKPELALAAYNAGNSRVEQWLKEWGDLDMAEFVEQIPFAETRGYVKQVLSNRARYDVLTSSGR
jgi:soluble lytic murein transglycosylase